MKRLALVIFLLLCSSASADTPTKYSLAGGCWTVAGSGPLRFQASALGEYLLYTTDGKYRSAGGDLATPGMDSVWKADDALTLTNAVDGSTLSGVRAATGCADVPEVSLNAKGKPSHGKRPWSGVKGVLDQHAHLMAFEFLGGDFHCGRPWSPFGVTTALPDCASIQGPRGSAAPFQNFFDFGNPVHPHDTVGWPTFNDWPTYSTLSYEQTYYRWLQRAYMGGLRLIETNAVDNEVLCRMIPMHHTTCNDMDAIRLQTKDLHQLQDYIDAQSGGPGKGWFQIVTDPFQAREVINSGKLAVVEGAEVSRLFGCGIKDDVPECSADAIDKGMDELRALGIRSFFPIHKFDNAFGGTKMDSGPVGSVINAANKEETGAFWSVQTCKDAHTDHDQLSTGGGMVSPLAALGGAGQLPTYPATPHCNTRGLTDLGKHVLEGMMDRHFLIEIDHMSAKAADESLSLIEARKYSGVMSSHTWANDVDLPRIRALGGSVTPYAGDSSGFAAKWRYDRVKDRSPKFPYAIGYGADMNGLGAQGPPRPGNAKNPVVYPFKGGDGAVTFRRQRSGSHVFDINRDGVAHYGLIPDWLEDLRVIAGPKITHDLFNGAEGYLSMWERADGIPGPSCPSGAVTSHGLGPVVMGTAWRDVLARAGQPWLRPGLAYRWCHGSDPRRVDAVFKQGRVALVGRVGRPPASVLAAAKPLTRAIQSAPAGHGRVYLMRGRKSFAVASMSFVRGPVTGKRAMRQAGL